MKSIESLSAVELASHVHWVRRVARALVRGGDAADDVAQETWLSALRHPPRHEGDLRRWFTAVARNVVGKLARSESRREKHEGDAAIEAARASGGLAPPSDLLVARAQLQQRVAAAVLELAEPYRSTLLARYFEELPPAAIATKLAVPVETVKTRLKRGLEQLRERLAAELGDDDDAARGGDGTRTLMAALSLIEAPIEEWLPDAPAADAPPAEAPLAESLPVDAAATTIAASSPLLLVAAGVVAVAATLFTLSSSDGDEDADTLVSPASVASNEGALEAGGASTEAVRVEDAAQAVGDAPAVAAPAPPAATTGTIRGVVVGPDGEPVGGAMLWLDRQSSQRFEDENAFHRSVSSLQSASGNLPWRVATSADDGSFLFADIADEGCFAIGAMHPSIGCGWLGGLLLGGEIREVEACVELESGVVVHGTVRDSDGAPLAGAGVMFDGSTRPWRENVDRLGGSWHCDGEGRYRTVPFPWRYVMVYAGCDAGAGAEYQPSISEVHAIPEGVAEWELDLVLARAPSIEGAIVDLAGGPAALATTLVPRLTEGERTRQSRETIALVAFAVDPRTDPACIARVAVADGTSRGGSPTGWEYGEIDIDRDSYRIVLHQPALHWLALVARDALLGVVELPEPSVLAEGAGPPLAVDPSLLRAAPRMVELMVHARDAVGEPLEYVSLRGWNLGFDERGHPSHDVVMLRPLGSPVEPGAYPIDEPADQRVALEPGEWWIGCVRGRHATRYLRVSARDGMEPLDLSVALEADGHRCSGIVVDGAGTPVAGAQLRLYRPRSDAACEPITTHGSIPGTTDPAGRFSIADVAAVPSLLVVTSEAFAPSVLRVDPTSTGATIEAHLAAGHEVAIRLDRADGGKVKSTRWQLLDGEGVPLIDDDFPYDGRGGHWSAMSTVRLAGGDYRLIVRGPDGLRGETEFTVVTADDGRTEVRGPTVSSNGEVALTLAVP